MCENDDKLHRLSLLLIYLVINLSLFAFCLYYLSFLFQYVESESYVSIVTAFIFLSTSLLYVRYSGLSWQDMGITTYNFWPSLCYASLLSIPLCLVIIVFKILLIHYHPMYADKPLVDWQGAFSKEVLPESIHYVYWSTLSLYCLFIVPVQEFLLRCIVQSAILKFCIFRKIEIISVLLTGLLAATTHIAESISFPLVTFIVHIFWSYLFIKHRNIIGPAFSHWVIGVLTFWILGIRFNF